MKRTDRKTAGFDGMPIAGAAIALDGGYKNLRPAQRLASAIANVAPETVKRPRGLGIIRVAKIDPAKGIAAIVPIKAGMRSLRTIVGTSHISMTLVTNIGMVPVQMVCAHDVAEGTIWRVRGSLPVRGKAVLIGWFENRPTDFPGDAAWLKRMIDFAPADIDRAVNDPRVKTDAAD